MKESDVDIEICPIDHVQDNDEPDIEIYPLEDEAPGTADAVDNHLSNGLNGKDGTSSDLRVETKHEKDETDDDRQGINVETVTDNRIGVVASDLPMENKLSLDDELYRQVLSGNTDIAIPNTAKMVRIFTSSTFTGNQQFRFQLSLNHR